VDRDDVPEPLATRVMDAARMLADELSEGGASSPVNAVVVARDLAQTADDGLRHAVDRARAAGHTWQELGDVLGITRQAAFQRFGRPVDPRTGEPMSTAVLPGAAERATELFTTWAAGAWDDVCQDFGPAVASRLDAAGVASAWARVVAMVGTLERMGEPFARQHGDVTVVDVPLAFEAGDLVGRVRYDSAGSIAGIGVVQPWSIA
jgi:acetyl esterase/lipase